MPVKCLAVIPCLNEAAAIGRVVHGVREFLPDVWVVDDGSTDATAAAARAAGATVFRHETTQGKGAALAAGLAEAGRQGFAWAIVLDGDGQHAPADIPRFLARAAEVERARPGRVGLIVGDRMSAAAHMPWVRRRVNQWMSRRLSRVAGSDLPDTQCGFRMIRLEPWSRIRWRTRHFEIESEMLLEFLRAGLEVEFVPVQVIYKSERSKIHPVRDTVRWLRWLRSVR